MNLMKTSIGQVHAARGLPVMGWNENRHDVEITDEFTQSEIKSPEDFAFDTSKYKINDDDINCMDNLIDNMASHERKKKSGKFSIDNY